MAEGERQGRDGTKIPLSESFNGQAVTNGYDSLFQRSAVGLNGQPSTLVTYGFDAASRLSSVANGVNTADYTYVANSHLISQIAFKNNGTTRMTTFKAWDKLNRLTSVSSGATVGAAYDYNAANQRTRNTQADGYWVYEYDALGQVVSGKKFGSDGTPIEGQQFEYAFDEIGNRSSAKAGGDSNGANLRSATYTADRLNRYSSRTVPGAIDILGAAKATASVTVNSVAATTRRSEYYHKEVSVANSGAAVWQSIAVTATEGANNTTVDGNLFVPQTPENYGFDFDGNQTTDGRWTYTWDAENRLTCLVANTAVGPQQRLDFEYDWQGRRISKKVWNNTAGTGTPAANQRFLYDGWNLLAIVDSAAAATHSFVWGTDLSGSLRGAGGVGGLISLKVHTGVNAGTYSCSYDGNGNVIALANAVNGTVVAQYEYSPFGETMRSTGPIASENPFRFSTKFSDAESNFAYYGYRYYNATSARWLSRDPITDEMFLNTLMEESEWEELDAESLMPADVFVRNDGINQNDRLGLQADVTWNPSAKLCHPFQTAFIQVGYGGWGKYKTPFVDDGSAGFYTKSTGCPEYPNFGKPGAFEDSPKGATGPVKFIVCAVCTEICGCAGTPEGGRRVIRVAQCKTWKKGDVGSIGHQSTSHIFKDAAFREFASWQNAVQAKYPNWRKCYKCKHRTEGPG